MMIWSLKVDLKLSFVKLWKLEDQLCLEPLLIDNKIMTSA